MKQNLKPYRKNVCAIVIKPTREILLVEKEHCEWQFVQGGVNNKETLQKALLRELYEETGITSCKIVGQSTHLNRYDWPEKLQQQKGFRGQEQHFFIVQVPKETKIKLQESELTSYQWVSLSKINNFITREDLVESFEIIKKEFRNLFS